MSAKKIEFAHLSWDIRVTTTLTEGVIDEAASRVFKTGQCHAMAFALHKETGWSLVGFKDNYDSDESPGHCAVFCPQLDEYVDVDGLGARQRWEEKLQRCGRNFETVPLKQEQMNKLHGYVPMQANDAEPFAKAVVKQIVDSHGIAVLQNPQREEKQWNQLSLPFSAVLRKPRCRA